MMGILAAHGKASEAEPVNTLEIKEQNAAVLAKLAGYSELESLSIECLEPLRALPDSIGQLTRLKNLILDNGNGCVMNPRLPASIGNLHQLEKLVLYGAQDPRGIGHEPPVQPGQRHEFPVSMSELKSLRYLDLGRNGLRDIPAFVADLPKLEEFRFQWNELKTIPSFIANVRALKTLMLDANSLSDLPDFLNSLPKLNRITLGNNCSITQSDAKMRDLKRRFPKIRFDFTDEYDCPTK